jgi:hypothetical protein
MGVIVDNPRGPNSRSLFGSFSSEKNRFPYALNIPMDQVRNIRPFMGLAANLAEMVRT